MSHFSFMYFLQINGGQITFSSETVNPKPIHETFKKSLLRIFMRHVNQDPLYGSWHFLTRENEPMEELLHNCKILISYQIAMDAWKLRSPSDVLVWIVHLCKYYLPDTYNLRVYWRVQKWRHNEFYKKIYHQNTIATKKYRKN